MSWTTIAQVSANVLDAFPIGAIVPFSGSSAPSGWLLCDGSAVSRTTYAALYAIIGTSWGAGNGTTTFNLPDLRGRIVVGKGSHADVDTLGENDGVTESSRTPKHTHAQNMGSSYDNQNSFGNVGAASSANSDFIIPNGGGGGLNGNFVRTGVASSTPPFGVANFIIKALASALVTLDLPLSIANGGTGQTVKASAFDALSPLTTLGDLLYYNGTNNVRLAANSSATKKYLQSLSGGAPSWAQVDYSDLSSVPSTFAIATPGTLTVSTTNSASGAHTHAITTSSDVSAGTSAILASNAGALTLRTLSVTNNTGAIVTMQAASAASTYLVAKTNGGSIRGSFGWRHDTDEGGIGNDAQWIMNWGAGSNPTVKFRSTGLHTFSGSVGIGDDPVTNLYVKGASVALDKVIVRDTLADGYSSIGFQDYNGASACGFGYANPSGWAPLANKLYFYSVSKSIKFSIDGGTTAHLYINAADGGTSVASVNQNASGAKLRVAGHITCDVDAASDLGTSTLRWGNIYGAPVLNTVTKTDSYTAGAADCVIVCNKATAMTITLPAATGNGKHYIISSIGAGAVLVDANGSETIAGQLTQTINQYESMQIVDYASGKWIIV